MRRKDVQVLVRRSSDVARGLGAAGRPPQHGEHLGVGALAEQPDAAIWRPCAAQPPLSEGWMRC